VRVCVCLGGGECWSVCFQKGVGVRGHAWLQRAQHVQQPSTQTTSHTSLHAPHTPALPLPGSTWPVPCQGKPPPRPGQITHTHTHTNSAHLLNQWPQPQHVQHLQVALGLRALQVADVLPEGVHTTQVKQAACIDLPGIPTKITAIPAVGLTHNHLTQTYVHTDAQENNMYCTVCPEGWLQKTAEASACPRQGVTPTCCKCAPVLPC
jgi:hypothetical protein